MKTEVLTELALRKCLTGTNIGPARATGSAQPERELEGSLERSSNIALQCLFGRLFASGVSELEA